MNPKPKRAGNESEPLKGAETIWCNGHRSTAVPASRKSHLLVVEDRDDFGKTLKKTLERWGEVTWVRNFDQALARFSTHSFSALIVDIMLPGRSGFEVLEEFRKLHPLTPAMVLTGYFDGEGSHRACELGAQYVAKPITTLGLQRFVEGSKPAPPVSAPAEFGLSPAEQKVFGLLAQRFSNREVAESLKISVETAKSHVKQILAKLDIRSRKDLPR
jgi:DNA-binding NarL/FixJ family response regulator